jgi:DNA repair protein RecO (recombination protein O)
MIETSAGLILRTRPLTETSLIVHWLTPDLGRIATVAKGARRPKSTFRGKLDLFYRGDFSFMRSRRSELHALREVSLQETHAMLRRDLGALQQASYAAGLVEQSTEAETPIPEISALVNEFVDFISTHESQPQFVFAFELKLMTELGLQPDLDDARLTQGARAIAHSLASGDWEHAAKLKLTAPQVNELRQFLHGFLVYHLGKVPSGRGAH